MMCGESKILNLVFFCVCVWQMEVLNLRVQQETQKKTLFQADLNVQRQEVSNLYSSEKQLKQELNHLLELKLSLEKQNQELCRWIRFHDGWYIYITMILFFCVIVFIVVVWMSLFS